MPHNVGWMVDLFWCVEFCSLKEGYFAIRGSIGIFYSSSIDVEVSVGGSHSFVECRRLVFWF